MKITYDGLREYAKIFFGVGIVFIIISIIIFSIVFNYSNKIDTKGTVVDVVYLRHRGQVRRNIFIVYDVNEVEYEEKLMCSNYEEGDVVDIYYDKNNPTKIGMKEQDKQLIVLPAMAIGFFFVSGCLFVVSKSKRFRNRENAINSEIIEDEENYLTTPQCKDCVNLKGYFADIKDAKYDYENNISDYVSYTCLKFQDIPKEILKNEKICEFHKIRK